jgi:hypothetical protein
METPDVDATPSSRPDNELITISGGVELEVTHLDGSKETVKVRQIPISQIQKFALAMGNEAELIALYCDKPKDWTDSLKLESANAVADKGQEINLPFFAAWYRRQAKWRESQTPGAIKELEKKLTELIVASRLPNSAQPSPTTTD